MIYHTTTTEKSIEVHDPHRTPDVRADFLVPFLQSLALGTLFGGPIGWHGDGPRGAAICSALFTGLIFALLIFVQQRQPAGSRRHTEHHNQVIPILRGPVGERRPAPGVVLMNGAPRPATPQAQAQADHNGADQLARFVLECERCGTSSHYWESRIARPDFVRMRSELIRAGYAAWRGATPRDGWYLTRPAAEIIAAIRKPPTPAAQG